MTYLNATGQIGAEGRYWDALDEGRLELPRCKGCGKWHWPAVWRCGECGSWEHEWVEQPMAGTIFTWTRTHHRFGGTEGIAVPYVTVLVELDAVPIRLQGLLEGEEQGLKIGAKVTGRVDRTSFGEARIPSLRWKLA
jgi:uncharacterized OB-fold protein